jgi:hypothetical protein
MKLLVTRCLSCLLKHKVIVAMFLFLLLTLSAVIPGQIPGVLDLCCLIIQGELEANRMIAELEIAAPLKTINEIYNRLMQFEQEIYSVASLDAIKVFLSSVGEIVGQWKAVLSVPVRSATLPNSIALENSLLSLAKPLNLPVEYDTLFGTLPNGIDASSRMRHNLDMADSAVKVSLTNATLLNSLVTVQLNAADDIESKISATTGPTAPMLEAESSAWLIRSSGFLERSILEMSRMRSLAVSHAVAQMKMQAIRARVTGIDINSLNRTP